jgi:hypothetical protein
MPVQKEKPEGKTEISEIDAAALSEEAKQRHPLSQSETRKSERS